MHRWTLDTLDDYRFLSAVFAKLGTNAADVGMLDVLRVVESNAELLLINAHVEQKPH